MACARTTNAVAYLMRKRGHYVHCYLDELVGVAPTRTEAKSAFNECIELTNHLGLILSPNRCTPPAKQIEWLGFHIDAQKMQVTIP